MNGAISVIFGKPCHLCNIQQNGRDAIFKVEKNLAYLSVILRKLSHLVASHGAATFVDQVQLTLHSAVDGETLKCSRWEAVPD
jgi:hypothetical protein